MNHLPPLPPSVHHDSDPADVEGMVEHTVAPGAHGRLDKLLAQLLPEHSRGRIQSWIEAGHVTVNGKVETRARHTVRAGDQLQVVPQPAPEDLAFVAEDIPLNVLAETPAYVVVSKPAGLVVHPGAGNWQGTLLNGLLYRYPELRSVARAGIVHRLDKDTSGLLVVARTEVAQTAFVRQLQDRSVERKYVAVVQGHLRHELELDAPIGRDPRVPIRMSAHRPVAAKPALTWVEPLRCGIYQGQPVSEVVCRLGTGRTHQIRVHLSQAGYPLLGDVLYGGRELGEAQRQMLHAWRLGFVCPDTGETATYECELAADMQNVLADTEWEPEPPRQTGDDFDDEYDDDF